MKLNLAIIGGGLTGTSLLCQFLRKVRRSAERADLKTDGIRISVFEKQNVFGPGFPHSDRYVLPYHITNMCDRDMGILAERPTDFQEWAESHLNLVQDSFHEPDTLIGWPDPPHDRCRHYPRAVMGEYLKARFREALESARSLGIQVELFPRVEVTDLKEESHLVRMTARRLSDGERLIASADRVLLATGHWFEEAAREGYFSSPWPARKLLRDIPPGERVGVIGTSLSAIEAALTLTSDGTFQRRADGELIFLPADNSRIIALYSRRGMIPKVRGRTGRYRNRFLTRENLEESRRADRGWLRLDSIFRLLSADLESAYGRPVDWKEVVHPTGTPIDRLQRYLKDARAGDGAEGEVIWQTVLHQSFNMAREIYLSLALEDRKRFDREYTTLFFMHAATQPTINAEKLLALLKAGIVNVHSLGDHYRLLEHPSGDGFVFDYSDEAGRQRHDFFRYVVNARGQATSLETNPSELYRNLRRSRTIQLDSGCSYKTGSVWIDPLSHRVQSKGSDGSTVCSQAIYAVGAMTRGQILDTSMAQGIARSTARIAGDWVDQLISPPSKTALQS